MIGQTFKMAWSAIASNKMRSFLTMLGIIIGVIAIVVLVSLVGGATSSITGEIEDVSANALSVTISDDKGHPLTLSDIQALERQDDSFGQVAPLGTTVGTIKKNVINETAQVNGTTAAYADIHNLKLGSGRFLKTADVENGSSVAVLNANASHKLFGTLNSVGNRFSLDGQSFLVVGVLEDSEDITTAVMGDNPALYIPFTVESRMAKQPYVTSFSVSPSTDDSIDEAEDALNKYMLQRFRGDADAFSVLNQSVFLDTIDTVTSTMTLLLGGIAAISLIVGGIGIMNIMLVSVTERTREIGIRKAIGASRSSILVQFLIEALVLCLIGCGIGLLGSWALLELIGVIAGDMLAVDMSAGVVGLAVGFSIAIGVVFGINPANKASKLQPIQALRYE
ncbi:ABC transporter permease [Christensenella intestinihominis]|uniref:ABC transporter permease n=1 Tax=Christensenella intestinihominis TaxID=1851429 RepID=UPI00082992C6|nr:ABC transporter permease [Christensenella intestinihominis]